MKILISMVTAGLFLSSFCMAAPTPTPRPKPKQSEPINIIIGDPASNRSSSSSNPPRPASSSPRMATPSTSSAASNSKLDGVATLPDADKAKTILERNLQKLEPNLEKWRKAAGDLQSQKGITPDFRSKTDIDNRLKMLADFAAVSRDAAGALDQGIEDLSSDLKTANVAADTQAVVVQQASSRFTSLKSRMAKAVKMSEAGTAALKILKMEWGDWRFSSFNGLEFEPSFEEKYKGAYQAAVQEFERLSQEVNEIN